MLGLSLCPNAIPTTKSTCLDFQQRKKKCSEAYFLKRLNDFVHVNELTIIGLEREIHVDAPNLVGRHVNESLQNDSLPCVPGLLAEEKP